MNARFHPSARRRHVPFLFWGWAMLLVVLMSAAPTGAQARVRLVGSAFDPASLSVALSPKQPKAKQAALKAASRDVPEGLTGTPPLAVGAVFLQPPVPAASASAPAPAASPYPSALHPALSPRAHGARAPPLS